MSLIILDMGSGNTCKNDVDYAKRMIDAVAAVRDEARQKTMVWPPRERNVPDIFLKWQLEELDPKGQKKLDRKVFEAAFDHGRSRGFSVGSSVFDDGSLGYLLDHGTDFVKIACRPDLYHLITDIDISMKIPVLVSIKARAILPVHCVFMACIPEYPATLAKYEETFEYPLLKASVSDHSPGLDLWRKYQPQIWEKHFVLERDEGNPDAGPFAITPDQLKEVIG